MAKISIITVVYNNKEGIEKTIESVVNQTYPDIEYIVIDGGSTDQTTEIIKKYGSKISYWISEKDTGIYNAMNKGISASTGDYLHFLNSGDALTTNDVLENFVGSMSADTEIAYGNLIKLTKDGTVVDKGPARSDLTLYDLYDSTINHSGGSFIKKSLFDKFGLYDESYKIVSDWVFFLRTIGLSGVKVQYIDCDISYFDMSGISNQMLELRMEERQRALHSLLASPILSDYKEFSNVKQLATDVNLIKHYSLLRLSYRLIRKIAFYLHDQ